MTKAQQIVKKLKDKYPGHSLQYIAEVLEAQLTGVKPTYRCGRVTAREFVTNSYYTGSGDTLWPAVVDAIEEVNNGEYIEAVCTGGIGSAKTTVALYSILYQVYLLSCMTNPHEVFGLDPASEILIVFQNKTAAKAKRSGYDRFYAMVESSAYFTDHFPMDKDIKSEARFPNRVIVRPISGDADAAIGENVIFGLIDEVNYMIVKEKSSKTRDGSYDQAAALYSSISKRRMSRYNKKGKLPGVLFLVSSKRYPGEFTDKKMEQAAKQIAETGKTNIYVYDKREWDVKPEGSYSGNWFNVFIGDIYRAPRILAKDETLEPEDGHLITAIPEEFRVSFEDNILDAIRDTAGVGTLGSTPFMSNREKVKQCFGDRLSIFSRETTNFDNKGLRIYPNRIQDIEKPRWAHIDLGLNSDSAGLSIGYVDKFMIVTRGGSKEAMPLIGMDGSLEIEPPKGGDIQFIKIREILYALKKMGMNIRWVSYDSWQSVGEIQALRSKGIRAGTKSIDRTGVPYELTRNALYDNRIVSPHHEKLIHELITLEQDPKTGKIDHTPVSTKDVSDSFAGVVSGLTQSREVWAMHGINPSDVPQSVLDTLSAKDNMKAE